MQTALSGARLRQEAQLQNLALTKRSLALCGSESRGILRFLRVPTSEDKATATVISSCRFAYTSASWEASITCCFTNITQQSFIDLLSHSTDPSAVPGLPHRILTLSDNQWYILTLPAHPPTQASIYHDVLPPSLPPPPPSPATTLPESDPSHHPLDHHIRAQPTLSVLLITSHHPVREFMSLEWKMLLESSVNKRCIFNRGWKK